MKLAGMLAVVIVVMGGIGYWYYNDTQERMAILPVSYTHLRAHETKANLVCRLLLEKKKKKVEHMENCDYQ